MKHRYNQTLSHTLTRDIQQNQRRRLHRPGNGQNSIMQTCPVGRMSQNDIHGPQLAKARHCHSPLEYTSKSALKLLRKVTP